MAGGDIYGLLTLDKSKTTQGVEIDIGDGIKITVAKFGNPKFQDYWRAITKPYQRQIDNGTISDDDMEALLIDAMAHTILLGWDGITVKGKKFPHNVGNAVTLMTDLEEFRNIVAEESRKFANYRAEQMEEAQGN